MKLCIMYCGCMMVGKEGIDVLGWQQREVQSMHLPSWSQECWLLGGMRRWKLVTILPGQVWGPPLSIRHRNAESIKMLVSMLNGFFFPAAPPIGAARIPSTALHGCLPVLTVAPCCMRCRAALWVHYMGACVHGERQSGNLSSLCHDLVACSPGHDNSKTPVLNPCRCTM